MHNKQIHVYHKVTIAVGATDCTGSDSIESLGNDAAGKDSGSPG